MEESTSEWPHLTISSTDSEIKTALQLRST